MFGPYDKKFDKNKNGDEGEEEDDFDNGESV